MPNSIEPAKIPASKFVGATSRYINSTVVYYEIGTRKLLTFTTYKKVVSNVPSTTDSYLVIPPGLDYRPDLISQSVYNTPDLWYVLMEANNISDIFEFKSGLNIRVPSNP